MHTIISIINKRIGLDSKHLIPLLKLGCHKGNYLDLFSPIMGWWQINCGNFVYSFHYKNAF